MKNRDIRLEILGAGFKFWQVADAMSISNSTLSVRLRKELSEDSKAEIRAAIAKLQEQGEQEA